MSKPKPPTTDPPEGREAVWVQCQPCAHKWIACYIPMELAKFSRVLKALRCPMCGGGGRKIFLYQCEPELGLRVP